jgi:hypothetical protein
MATTYLESIRHFDKETQEWLIKEAPHSAAGLRSTADPRFAFMVGRGIDFGFENLGLSNEERAKLEKAYVTTGVGIPGTPNRLRYGVNPEGAVIEQGSGEDVMLPAHWMQGMYVLDRDVFVWIGKRVRPDQVGQVDFSLYHDEGDGYRLKPPSLEERCRTMNGIRQELLHLLVLNYAEQWVPNHIALEQLEHYGDQLIPGLIGCLGDYDSEVRQLAISLLDEAGLAATPALPAVIQKIADPDRLVRVAAAHCLQKFGPQAIEAVPILLPWLHDENEYIRLVAAVTILKIDPTKRDEMMPIVRSASASANPMVRGMAEEFLNEQ